MMTCETFRTRFAPDSDDAELLEHLRSCDRCLDDAAGIDPDVLFRAIGGEMVPPGGIDAFTAEVMQQVRVRTAENVARVPVSFWTRRLAAAAMFVIAIGGAVLFQRSLQAPAVGTTPIARARISPAAVPAPLASYAARPVIEAYQSSNATIVEVPAEPADQIQMVMIFDESLPADL